MCDSASTRPENSRSSRGNRTCSRVGYIATATSSSSGEDAVVLFEWRLDAEHASLSYLMQTPQGQKLWIPERYLRNRESVIEYFSQDTEFVKARALVVHSQVDTSDLLGSTLQAMCTTTPEDDPQAVWSDDEDEVPRVAQGEDLGDPISEADFDEPETALVQDMQYIDSIEFSNAWIDFVKQLTKKTGTYMVIVGVQYRLFKTIQHFQNQELFQIFCHDTVITSIAVALFGAIWLDACYEVCRGRRHNAKASASCSALLYSLWTIGIPAQTLDFDQFSRMVRIWESRLYLDTPDWGALGPSIEDEGELPERPEPTAREQMYLEQLESATPCRDITTMIMQSDSGCVKTPLERLSLDESAIEFLEHETIQLFASVDIDVLRSCISGRIAQDARVSNHPVQQALKLNAEQIDKPAIYIQNLVDDSSMSPTPHQLLEMIRIARSYISADSVAFDESAVEIDQMIAPKRQWPPKLTRKGYRRYCDWREIVIKKSRSKSTKTRSNIATFLDNLEERLAGEVSIGREHVSLARALVYIGFSKTPQRRLRQHLNHCQSNYILCLIQAILCWAIGKSFKMQQDIIHVCWRPAQAWLGEIYFHRLLHGYTNTGEGFSHYPAGCSNGGAYATETLEKWNAWTVWADAALGTSRRLMEEADVMRERSRVCRMEVKRTQKLMNRGHNDLRRKVEGMEEDLEGHRLWCELQKIYSKLLNLEMQS